MGFTPTQSIPDAWKKFINPVVITVLPTSVSVPVMKIPVGGLDGFILLVFSDDDGLFLYLCIYEKPYDDGDDKRDELREPVFSEKIKHSFSPPLLLYFVFLIV